MVREQDGKESACNTEDLVQSLGQEDPLEKGMATHSSIPAWKILWKRSPKSLTHGVTKTWTRLRK